ncbi:MAG TPA: hypothetical protein VKA55_05160 [Gammaproteobacteria bacterium]|nr:hypothetical protein [Gammaproteobacteria bacterium]
MPANAFRLAAVALILIAGCASQPTGPGHWQPLALDRVQLAAVALPDADRLADPRVCRYAREDLQRNLERSLPRRLAPVGFVAPGDPPPPSGGTGTLRVTITACRIESHQWDVGGGEPDITFYETLDLHVRLADAGGKTLLDRQLETVEQIQTDIPTPLFDFPHTVPAARIYGLFSQGRVWQSG